MSQEKHFKRLESYEIEDIFFNGDVWQIQQALDDYDNDTEYVTKEAGYIAAVLSQVFGQNDGLITQAIADSYTFSQLYNELLVRHKIWLYKVQSNIMIYETIFETILTLVTLNDEPDILNMFAWAIEQNLTLSVLEYIDRIWIHAIRINIDTDEYFEKLIYFYATVFDIDKEVPENRTAIIYVALTVGIPNHIKVLCKKAMSKEDIIRSRFVRMNLIRFIMNANTKEKELVALLYNIDENELSETSNWHTELSMTSSNVWVGDTISQRSDNDFISDVIPVIVSKIDTFKNSESDLVKDTITWLMNEMCAQLSKETKHDSYWTAVEIYPLLVGSSAEGTQCFYPNEFDYILKTNASKGNNPFDIETRIDMFIKTRVLQCMKNAMRKMESKHLIMESFKLVTERKKYPCLSIIWTGQVYRNMLITIDLVPVNQIVVSSLNLPKHNYLYVRQETNEESGLCAESSKQKNERSYNVQEQDGPTPRLYNEIRNKPVYSEVENQLIRSLPEYIKQGYRIAKAFRLTCIIRPVIPQLVRLGVTENIHDLLKSYMLKTCVFYLTQNYVHISIYEQFQSYLIDGKIVEFFAKTKSEIKYGDYEHTTMESKILFECEHSAIFEELRYFCCRKRKAMMLIADRILHVLYLWRKRVKINKLTQFLALI